jgi:mannose-6-phosphate isomerase-like protein (cupin superfamily)
MRPIVHAQPEGTPPRTKRKTQENQTMNNRQEISIRIRGAREAMGLSVVDAAKKLAIDLKTYMAYEDGSVDVPMGALPQIAALYNTDPFAILTGVNPHSKIYAVTRAGRGPVVERRKAYHYESLNAGFADAKMMPYIVTVEPHDDDTVHLNAHPGDEFDQVIEGQLEVIIEGHSVLLNAGDSIYYNSGKMHGMRALGGKPAKFLAVITA